MTDNQQGSFDLTTALGLAQVNDFFKIDLLDIVWPQRRLWTMFFDWLKTASDVAPAKQAEAAELVIAAARRNGAKRVRFKVDKTVAVKLKANITDCVIVGGSVGVDGTMELEVEF